MFVVARGVSKFAEAFLEIRLCPLMLMYVRCAPVVDLQESEIRDDKVRGSVC